MMSLLDGMTAHLFRTDPETGRVVFFPNGAMGGGYELTDAAMEKRLRSRMRLIMLGAIAFGSIGVQVPIALYGQPTAWPAAMWWAGLGAAALVHLLYQFMLRRMVAGLPVSRERLTFKEALSLQTLGLPRWYFYGMAIFGPLLLVGTILWLANAASFMERVWAVVGLILFSVVTVQAFAGLRLKPDEPEQPRTYQS